MGEGIFGEIWKDKETEYDMKKIINIYINIYIYLYSMINNDKNIVNKMI